jgi:tetratricopeptide (TPR) repeat protein
MKPRLFIGSSQESLNIAYAAQQNLQRAAEVTAWDQGVFQLSVTALESLLEILGTCDFGMFVFSPDDVVTIRGEQNSAVRDNVIFELGLFVAVLGRERCFMLVPDKQLDLRIPTDLIGMTPATFETGRTDGSMQAATAPACHAISQMMERFGMRAGRVPPPKHGTTPDETAAEDPCTPSSAAVCKQEARSPLPDWLDALCSNEYARAAELLQESLSVAETDDVKADLDSWLGHVKLRLNAREGERHLEGVIERYPIHGDAYCFLAQDYLRRDMYIDALAVVERGLKAAGPVTELVLNKIRCLSPIGDLKQLEDTLRKAIAEKPEDPYLYIALADHYSDRTDLENARDVLEDANKHIPRNTSILEKYARLLEKLPDKKLALIPYEQLIEIKPEDARYLTLRANAFLELGLNDLAMRDYKKANELAKNSQGWILANIGNLLITRGLYREGIEYLKHAIGIEPESEYAHNRLSAAIKARDEEESKLQELLKVARRELIAAKLQRARVGIAEIADKSTAPNEGE